MPLYEPVARYHVSNSPDLSDDDDLEVDERQSFISYRGGIGTRRIPTSHVVANMSEAAEAALAAAELDGNRPRKVNPLTIIQVKNPEKNLDDGSRNSSTFFAGIFNPVFAFASNTSGPKKFCCAAVSTFLCLSVSVGLLSLSTSLPCDGQPDCAAAMTSSGGPSLPARMQTQKTNQRQWLRVFDDITLSSGIEVVTFTSEGSYEDVVLVSGYHSTTTTTTTKTTTTTSAGLIGIDALDGTQRWRRTLTSKPTNHDCHLVNLNEDNHKDCLVVGERGLVAAINPKNGDELWYLLYHIPLVNVSLPRRLPDLDGDGTYDLVAACAVTLPSEVNDQHPHPRTNFILISGKTGTIIGRPYLVTTCTDLSTLNITSELTLQFDCVSELGPDQFEMTLEELYSKVTNQHLPVEVRQLLPDPIGYQFTPGSASEWRQFERVGDDPSETIKDSIHLDWIHYYRQCPECGVRVKLWDGFAHRILWNKSWANAVAFQPRSTRYETERWDSPIEGFVFRLWQWKEPLDTFTFGKTLYDDNDVIRESTSTKSPPTKRSQSEDEPEEEESIFKKTSLNSDDDYGNNDNDDSNRALSSPYEWISNLVPFGHPNVGGGRHILSIPASRDVDEMKRRTRRNVVDKKSRKVNFNSVQPTTFFDTSRMLNVTETIFYATLNHTNPQLITLFSHEILQKCDLTSDKKTFACAPHYNTHANSMVILERRDDPDARDLVFSTQTLVQEFVRTTVAPPNVKNRKPQNFKPELTTRWTIRTSLRKLSLAKDIEIVPHL